MATMATLKAAIDQFVDKSAVWAYAIINGGPLDVVTTDSGDIPTFRKALADFEAKTIRTDIVQAHTQGLKQQALQNIGLLDETDVATTNGVKFTVNPDGGFDLELFDQITGTYRKVRLNDGQLLVE